VPTCPSCGNELPGDFPFCPFCGAALSAPAVERRKLATLLFCDLSGSTAMGERVDAESLQDLLRSYFQEMRAAVERHGGTVEKFIGDAVMAAFGVPETHEDDALRACRAALEMQARIVGLNESLEQRFGTSIDVRIGVNTGEVVTGGEMSNETFATGDAVNVAARLEQAAAPGEVLLGEPTYRLVRGAVRVEAVEPVNAKGKSEPVRAYRLLEADMAPVPRSVGTPLAGREDQLRLLERELATVVTHQRSRLVTVVGEPGVGKSRLTAEFVSRLGARARVVRGTCLSYGEGITFWSIGEIVRELAGIHDDHSPAQARTMIEAHVEGVENGPVVAANLAQLLGMAEGSATSAETAWAIRQFLIAEAHSGPLLVVVEDIHWAEDTLLDLLAGLPAAIGEAPILLLCLARPELLEHRPEWEVTVRLEALGADDVDALVRSLLGEVPEAVRERLAEACAGNPLFAEELVAMLLDEGVLHVENGACTLRGDLDTLALPASLHALLGARLDRLDPEARAALERGAIEGELFHRDAILELSPPALRPSVPVVLQALIDDEIVRPEASSFGDEAGFRFKHILVRDTAYQGTAKKLRAALHAQFADWLERAAGDRVTEYEEILGHHLEQSYRYRAELGPIDDETRVLGERAGARLAAAGRRAHGRGDLGAVANLLGRAVLLLPAESRERIEVSLALVEALADFVRLAEAEALLEHAGQAALKLRDDRLTARVNVERAWLVVHAEAERSAERWVLSQAEQAIPIFERLGDDIGLARAMEVVAIVHFYFGRLSEVAAASKRGYLHAERAQNTQEQGKHRLVRMMADQWGTTPFDQTDDLLENDLAWARRTGSLGIEARAMVRLGVVRALRGDRVEGNELFARGMASCSEMGASIFAYQELGCWIWALTDDPGVAEARLRETYDVLADAGRRGVLSTVAAILAECLYRQGRDDEAADLLTEAAEQAADDDVATQVYVRTGRAKLAARRGDLVEAEALALEGVALAAETEFVDLLGDSLLALAEVQRQSGRTEAAAETVREALALWETKGNVVYAEGARTLLAGL
jgi:class 3 adenylate cyclase/tetratricopeptide (TPR) repeat protein